MWKEALWIERYDIKIAGFYGTPARQILAYFSEVLWIHIIDAICKPFLKPRQRSFAVKNYYIFSIFPLVFMQRLPHKICKWVFIKIAFKCSLIQAWINEGQSSVEGGNFKRPITSHSKYECKMLKWSYSIADLVSSSCKKMKKILRTLCFKSHEFFRQTKNWVR